METLQFILTNIIFPLVVTFIGIYVFPRIESYLKNRSLSSRQRKIEALKREYRLKKLLNEHSSLLVPFVIKDFIENLTAFIIVSAFSGFLFLLITYFLNNALGRLLYGIGLLFNVGYNAFTMFFRTIHLIDDSLSFSVYRVEAIAKMIKLGGNPEDLDKEE